MNCLNHPDTPAAAFCRSCGKPLCEVCKRPAQGTIYCEEHVPAAATAPATPPPPASTDPYHASVPQERVADPGVSPGLALTLGLIIPGVGAIYNGQYAKGLVHAIIFGLLVSIVSSNAAMGLEPLFGFLIAAWVFYMGLEAYHTARKRRAGEPVDEISSLIDLHVRGSRFPAGAVVLIIVGMLLLLNTTDIIPFERIIRYWPVLLIVFGLYLLYARLAGISPDQVQPPAENRQEVHHDQR